MTIAQGAGFQALLPRTWRRSLPVTFWLFYVAGVSTLSGFWMFYLIGVLEWRTALPGWLLAAEIILAAYWITASVAVWKSSGAYMRSPRLSKHLWAWLARGFVIFWALLTLFFGLPALTIVTRLVLAVVGAILMMMGFWHPSSA